MEPLVPKKKLNTCPNEAPSLSPPELANRYGVGVRKILSWIQAGQLHAVNVALNPSGERPQWRILQDDMLAFEQRRSSPAPATPAPRRRRSDTNDIQFFR